jgi:hypothetical protein
MSDWIIIYYKKMGNNSGKDEELKLKILTGETQSQ